MTSIDPFEILALIVTIGTVYTGAIVWIVSRLAALSEKESTDVGALRLEMDTRVNAAKEAAAAGMESIKQEESKLRHQLANATQSTNLQMQTQINQLRDNGATKSELQAVESRLTVAISEVKVQVVRMGDKLDIIPEIKAELSALSKQIREAIGVRP